jgi:hypothetical protein
VIWVAWRQQRAVLLSLAAYALVLIAVMVYFQVRLAVMFDPATAVDCSDFGLGGLCSTSTEYWNLRGRLDQWNEYTRIATLGFAALAGAFIGAPMFAREWEQRTHLLVLSQSISARRWFTTRVTFVLTATVLGAALLGFAQWWTAAALHDPVETWKRLRPIYFEVQPVALVGYTLFAVALGVTAGLVLQRTLPAMAVTLLGVVGAVFAVQKFARPDYMTPVLSLESYGSAGPTYDAYRADPGRWSISQGFADLDGKMMADNTAAYEAMAICERAPGERGDAAFQECLAGYGTVGPARLVHPSDRFWPFQFIEFGLFAAAAVVLIALSLWWLRKRSA